MLKEARAGLDEGKTLEAAVALRNLGQLNTETKPEFALVKKALEARLTDLVTVRDWIQLKGFRQDISLLGIPNVPGPSESKALWEFYRESKWVGAMAADLLEYLGTLSPQERLEAAGQLYANRYYQPFRLASQGIESKLLSLIHI